MAGIRTLLAASAIFAALSPAAWAAGELPPLKSMDWPHAGPFGTFDRASLQRGFQVYTEVCAACHSLKYLHFRQLEGIGLSAEEIKAVAAGFEVVDGPNEDGDMFERDGKPADRLPQPFENDQQARAANAGALPPDLSLIVKSRKGHENYVYSLMTGYGTAPAGMQMREGMNYNAYFPGHQIAMPPPLSEDGVEYSDGTKATVDQMAYDVTNFLAWAASPKLENRKKMGLKVMIFLAVFTGLLIAVKKKVWSDVH